MTNLPREWVLRQTASGAWEQLVTELGIHPITAKILVQRGIEDPEIAHTFMNPSLDHLHDPFSMKGMKKAVAEVLKAIERGQRIMIHGDYDVDGVCSVSLLYGFLSEIGADVGYYIPHRKQDGYGLNPESVKRFAADGVGLLITTDCGISNLEEITLANRLGLRCVIVDHHTIPEELPPARAILNPLQTDCDYPYKPLAAVGVTFNLVMAIRTALRKRGVFDVVPEPDILGYMDLVAMGTIADVMPLNGQNRLFARLGLEVLSRRRRAGIAALMDRASVEVGPADTSVVSYRLAPRINAAGRMSDASMCVELLTTRDYALATKLASQLEVLNGQRQEEERSILDAAIEQAERQVETDNNILVVFGEDWHRGVLGIVASRLTERFHRPAILMGIENGIAKGSARSVEGINLVESLGQVEELLATFGGHAAAAGLSLNSSNLEAFQTRINQAVSLQLGNKPIPKPSLKIDGVARFSDLDGDLLKELSKLYPFGSANPEPVLLATHALASNVRVIAKKHLRARFRDTSGTIDGFGFLMSEHVNLLRHPVSLAFTTKPSINGESDEEVELQLRGVRPATDNVPDRVERV